MVHKVLAGKPVAQTILKQVISQTASLIKTPFLMIVTFGNDPASDYYFNNLVKTAAKVGIETELVSLDTDIDEIDLVMLLDKYNRDSKIDGILIQKPLPKHLNDIYVSNQIIADKDLDGITTINLGKLFTGEDGFVPCTADAVMELIRYYEIETQGCHVVILGRSNVVAKPLAALLLRKTRFGNATVTVCHTRTKDIISITKTADILIAAIGQPNFVKPDFLKPGAICIDVGINLISDPEKGNMYVGDIDFDRCQDITMAITPVPGGIGAITTAVLLRNLVKAASINQQQ